MSGLYHQSTIDNFYAQTGGRIRSQGIDVVVLNIQPRYQQVHYVPVHSPQIHFMRVIPQQRVHFVAVPSPHHSCSERSGMRYCG